MLPSTTVPGLGANDWPPRSPWMLIVVAPAVGGAGGAAGLPLEPPYPLPPPQFHDASATTTDAARIDDRKVLSFHDKNASVAQATPVPGAEGPGFCGLRGLAGPRAYYGGKEARESKRRWGPGAVSGLGQQALD